MASQNASNIVFRKDYTAPDHQIESIDLSFDLIPTCTEVTSKIIAVPQEDRKSDDLILDGDDLTLVSIKIAGEDSFPGQYDMRPGKLIIHNIKERTEIEIVTRINPRNNLELSGLYMSKNNYITQCEAEGFRRITYFQTVPISLQNTELSFVRRKTTKCFFPTATLSNKENFSTDATMLFGKTPSRNLLIFCFSCRQFCRSRTKGHLVRRP